MFRLETIPNLSHDCYMQTLKPLKKPQVFWIGDAQSVFRNQSLCYLLRKCDYFQAFSVGINMCTFSLCHSIKHMVTVFICLTAI